MNSENREILEFYKKNRYMRFPSLIQLEITQKCPFNCPQCYKPSLKNEHMDINKLKEIIQFCYERGTRQFVLNGGEPLLYPWLSDLFNLFDSYGDVLVSLYSSGFGVNEKIRKIISKDYVSFFISLNGSTLDINKLSRQGYTEAISAIDYLVENGCSIGINWVARHDNIKDFKNLIDLCILKGIVRLNVTSNKQIGTTRKIDSAITKKELIYLAQIINSYSGSSLTITVEWCFSQLRALLSKQQGSIICFAGKYSANVNIDGSFSPCTHLNYPEIFESIEDYWNNSNVLKKLRNLKPCSLCKYHCNFCQAMFEDYKFITDATNCVLAEKNNI